MLVLMSARSMVSGLATLLRFVVFPISCNLS